MDMQEKTAQFRARSGRLVKPRPDGSVLFDGANGYLSPETAMDAAEFFEAQRDLELGRWRCPSEPTYVVYPRENYVLTLREPDGAMCLYGRGEVGVSANVSTSERVAREYFEAHPERKPWHEAKHGEVWAVTETSGEALYRVTGWGRFEQVSGDNARLSMPITHWSITAARRVWPAGDAS